MITFIAFIITILGSINWLLIGALQYDFIAGLFGFQASIFSRICYIIMGIACVYLIIRVIANKGTLKVYEKRKKKKQEQLANVEASKEQISNSPEDKNSDKDEKENKVEEKQYEKIHDMDAENDDLYKNHVDDNNFANDDFTPSNREYGGLFDEHFKDR